MSALSHMTEDQRPMCGLYGDTREISRGGESRCRMVGTIYRERSIVNGRHSQAKGERVQECIKTS